jgi:hypothetical protein
MTAQSGVAFGSRNKVEAQYGTVTAGTWTPPADCGHRSAAVGRGVASGPLASISGGHFNTTEGAWAAVSGGLNNTASGIDATVFGCLRVTVSTIFRSNPSLCP